MSYLETTHALYREAALKPQASLCCTSGPKGILPGLKVPDIMYEMNYGCGTTVHFGELRPEENALYVGVGGGLEALQFAYTTRRPESVVAVDRVPEMLERAAANFTEAARLNAWFRPEFVRLVQGDALRLPIPDASVNVAAQNCLFNIFEGEDLSRALQEMRRVLKPGGRLYISDPVATRTIPEHLRSDERLRAMCLSGALPLEEYLQQIVAAGFGTIEVRARRPYRLLDQARYGLAEDLLLESVELVAQAVPVPADGPCIFAGESVIYVGSEVSFDDGRGHVVQRDVPLSVCRKTAGVFRNMGRSDLYVTAPTWHYGGGGCC